jgi:hypothetical protein
LACRFSAGARPGTESNDPAELGIIRSIAAQDLLNL